jgi:hypothetical protein
MNISKKIEEIRNKPDHERVRYVWGMVLVSMFFIILLWLVSLKDNFSNNYSNQEDVSGQDMELGEALGVQK